MELVFKNGLFVLGSTRGNGLVGEDVTQNLKTIEAVPLSLKGNKEFHSLQNARSETLFSSIVARGEALISKKEFAKINKEQEKSELSLYANPRNIAAGSIRQLDPQLAGSRDLKFLAYDIITDFGHKTHQEKHEITKS